MFLTRMQTVVRTVENVESDAFHVYFSSLAGQSSLGNTELSMHGRLIAQPATPSSVKWFPFFVVLCLNSESLSVRSVREFYGFKIYFYN